MSGARLVKRRRVLAPFRAVVVVAGTLEEIDQFAVAWQWARNRWGALARVWKSAEPSSPWPFDDVVTYHVGVSAFGNLESRGAGESWACALERAKAWAEACA